ETEIAYWNGEYKKASSTADSEIKTLRRLMSDQRQRLVFLDRIQALSQMSYDLIGQVAEGSTLPRLETEMLGFESASKLDRYFLSMLHQIDLFLTEERKVEQESLISQDVNRKRIETVLFAGVVFNILLCVALAVYFTRGIARRLNVIYVNSHNFAAGKPL